jgi:hypothetical protein
MNARGDHAGWVGVGAFTRLLADLRDDPVGVLVGGRITDPRRAGGRAR